MKRQFIFLEPLKNLARPKDARESLKEIFDVSKKNKARKEELLLLEGLYETYSSSNSIVSVFLVAAEYALSKSKEDKKVSKYFSKIIEELTSFNSDPAILATKLMKMLEGVKEQHYENPSYLSFEDSEALLLGVGYLSEHFDKLIIKYSATDKILLDRLFELDYECAELRPLIAEVRFCIKCMGGDPDIHLINMVLCIKYKVLDKSDLSKALLKPFIQELITKEISLTKIQSYSSDIGSKGGRPIHPHKHEALAIAKQKWEQIPSASVSVISTTVKSILEKKYTGAPKIAAIKKWLQDADFRPK